MHEKILLSVCRCFSKSIHLNIIRRITTSFPIPNSSQPNLPTTLASILQTCSDSSALPQAKQLHTQIITNGLSNIYTFQLKILGMYVFCYSLTDALATFLSMDNFHYCGPWNWMIRGFTMMGYFDFALLFYFKMLGLGISPDKYTFPYVIKACAGISAISLGRLVHENVRKMGFEMDVFVASALVKMYAENGYLDDARCLFDKIPVKDCVLWNVMLNGYVKNGEPSEAFGMFRNMRVAQVRANYVTFVSVLSVCASRAMIDYGSQVHGLVVKLGFDSKSPVVNTLLAMYSKCRCLGDARRLFSVMGQKDLVSWNGMIAGCVQNGLMTEALDLFHELVRSGLKPDSVTFASLLPLVCDAASLRQGKEIHGYIVRNDVCLDAHLKSSLVNIYFKCRAMEMACKVFNQTATIDVVICSAMISGYVLNGMNSDALEIFRLLLGAKMKPNSVTLASVLPACASLGTLKLGKELHGNILKNGLEGKCYVGSALTDMYAKCGRLDLAHQVFERICEMDSVAWNSMITSCSQNGKPEEAINLFRQMGLRGTKYDCVTISAALSACANLPALHLGKEIHCFMIKGSFRSDLFAESALIDMYAKCGDLLFARHVFNSMEGKNEVSWNSMIAAYGTHGCVSDALDLFHKMLEIHIQPDHITFLAIMSACGHAGLVDEGFRYFRSMTEEYGIMARMEHYACIVDLFGRAGRLDEALSIIQSMPFDPDAGIWGALLGACRVHRNAEIAEIAGSHIFVLDPQNSGYYTLLANVHADAGQWNSVLKVRTLMKERGVIKIPGCSWIEANGSTHMFVCEDTSHPLSAEIYLVLKSLLLELRKAGYVPLPYLPVHTQTWLECS